MFLGKRLQVLKGKTGFCGNLLCSAFICKTATVGAAALKTKDKKKTLSIFGSKYMLCKFQKCLSSCYENSVLVLKKMNFFCSVLICNIGCLWWQSDFRFCAIDVGLKMHDVKVSRKQKIYTISHVSINF